ncbi:MAG: Lsm family RNA-binding protein [Candidatus Helarchaeota archaeon]
MSATENKFYRELANLIGARVNVQTSLNNNAIYTGTLSAYDRNSMAIVLRDANDQEGNKFDRIVIYGQWIQYIIETEKPFDLKGLADSLSKIFPPGEVEYIESAGSIMILNKIKVTEDGVLGSGPLADRVKRAFDEFVAEKNIEKESEK